MHLPFELIGKLDQQCKRANVFAKRKHAIGSQYTSSHSIQLFNSNLNNRSGMNRLIVINNVVERNPYISAA